MVSKKKDIKEQRLSYIAGEDVIYHSKNFAITQRDIRGKSGDQDKFNMHKLEKDGKWKKLGTHPSFDGAKKYGKTHNLSEAKLSKDKLKKQYADNEDRNNHSENILLLAKQFGTKEEIADAEAILKRRSSRGHIQMGSPDDLRQKEINKKYSPKLKEGKDMSKKINVIESLVKGDAKNIIAAIKQSLSETAVKRVKSIKEKKAKKLLAK